MKIVIDTNVLLGAFLKEGNASRKILGLCLNEAIIPIIGNANFNEYEDVFAREDIFSHCPLNSDERRELLNAFYSVCAWQKIYYLWRPNLRDESDNHVLEIAVAANADYIITENKKDFANSELLFPQLGILNSVEFINVWSKKS